VKLVLDASVIVKWFQPASVQEAWTDNALSVHQVLRSGRDQAVQPPHWLAEVAAVLARVRPQSAGQDLEILEALELPVAGDLAIYEQAVHLSVDLDHHLFDTLYHAVALERQALLVTADGKYCDKAKNRGAIVHLSTWFAGADEVHERRS
jgi:predicted nucleic acid-binding protein